MEKGPTVSFKFNIRLAFFFLSLLQDYWREVLQYPSFSIFFFFIQGLSGRSSLVSFISDHIFFFSIQGAPVRSPMVSFKIHFQPSLFTLSPAGLLERSPTVSFKFNFRLLLFPLSCRNAGGKSYTVSFKFQFRLSLFPLSCRIAGEKSYSILPVTFSTFTPSSNILLDRHSLLLIRECQRDILRYPSSLVFNRHSFHTNSW